MRFVMYEWIDRSIEIVGEVKDVFNACASALLSASFRQRLSVATLSGVELFCVQLCVRPFVGFGFG